MSKILLVDDDNDMLPLSERWLIKAGYETLTATCGNEALDIIRTSKPDLVVTDEYMPDKKGSEIYEIMKSDDNLSDIPVIIRTGNEDSVSVPATLVPKAAGKPGLLEAISSILQ